MPAGSFLVLWELMFQCQMDLIEALVTEAEPKMFGQMLGTADADFYGHQTDHGSFVFGGAPDLKQ